METIRLTCRKSRLAIIQANEVISRFKEYEFSLIPVDSYGDKHKDISLLDNTASDFFTRELDNALRENLADIAVHSAKDIAYPLPDGIELIALTRALYKKDALVSHNKLKFKQLPPGSKVGTSSHSRKSQLNAIRNDLEYISIRGNIEERIDLMRKGVVDALVVAECALKRLELDYLIAELLPVDAHPLQGSLAVTARSGNHKMKSIFHAIDIRKSYGKVYLAGAGPGSAELLTLKAWQVLKNADVVFYDALIDTSILAAISCKKVYTGKRKGDHSMSQEAINNLMFEAASSGHQVVRLKGGDPQIFGRGGEEFDYLRERMIETEIIPGITSALAAAAITGIPLTHRKAASSVAFCSGSPIENIEVPAVDTLVYYMGAGTLKQIARKVIESGKSDQTPVALIYNISSPTQKTWYYTLNEVLELKKELPSPLLVIIGKTAMNKHLSASRPRILVTGTNPQKYEYLGEVVHNPIIQIKPFSNYEHFNPIVNAKRKYSWIIFTSKYAVKYFFQGLINIDLDIRWLSQTKILSIGAATSRELKKYGLIPDIQAEDESSAGIINLFMEYQISGKDILIPRSEIARNTLPHVLTKRGYNVSTLPVYQNIRPESYEKIDLNTIDIVVFSSPSGVKNFKEIYGDLPSHVHTISQGEITELSLYHYGFKVANDWMI